MPSRLLAAGLLALLAGPACLPAVPTTAGLYATFDVSWGNPVQTGSFTTRLEYGLVPRTVANFVTLAEGTRAWVNESNGEVRKAPYYEGITFHRVISGFMIQGGSPKGDGTDGPGYVFPDEFNANLRHNAAGILSMANSGAHTNGSQFFVTLAATAWLDDLHSVFGSVVENLSVVQAIGATAVDANSKPVAPARITKVTIHRVGTAAQAWDPLAQPLPVVAGAGAGFGIIDGTPRYLLAPAARSVTRFWAGTSVTSLAADGSAFDHDPTYDGQLTFPATLLQNERFFGRVVRVTYPDTLRIPTRMRGTRWRVAVSNITLTFDFTSDTAGTWSQVTPTGTTSGAATLLRNDVDPLRPLMGFFGVRLAGYYTDGAYEDYYVEPRFNGANDGSARFIYFNYGANQWYAISATYVLSAL